jgi:hypothetical protein
MAKWSETLALSKTRFWKPMRSFLIESAAHLATGWLDLASSRVVSMTLAR